MRPSIVSIEYSTRRMSDGYTVTAIDADGKVLAVLDRLTLHGYALLKAKELSQEHNLPLIDRTTDKNGFAENHETAMTNKQDWQETIYRLND